MKHTSDIKNKIILVIDNDKTSQYLLSCIFANKDYNLIFANNKDEVYYHCSNSKFDIVLTELLLPKTNAFALIKLIKRVKKEIPIIALTVCAMTHEKQKCFRYGCDAYISKPFITSNLIKKIETQLNI